MIRAHLATFPPRRSLMLDVVARMAPQVDQLFVVLNEYQTIPAELGSYANVVPILPPRDLKDAGKFLPQADPNDLVFLIDDDLAYPPDYVTRTRAATEGCDLGRDVFGYQGNALIHTNGRPEFTAYMFRQALDQITGAGLLGTGTVCCLGRHLPPLNYIENAAGFVDVRFARWAFEHDLRPWVLPRAHKWLRPTLPPEMKAQSLYRTVHIAQPELYMDELRSFIGRWPHGGAPYA